MPRQKKQHLKQRKDGRYVAFYKGMPFYGYTEDEALEKRAEYKRKEQLGFAGYVTLREYSEKWLRIAHPTVSKATMAGLTIHLNHLLKHLGEAFISDIRPLQIKEVYSAEYAHCSNSYIKAAKQLFVALFDSAVADGLITTNPARQTKPHKGAEGGHRAITAEERNWILTYCTDHRAYPAIITMLYAGIRPQEAKALNISKSVDFRNLTIKIAETVHYSGSNSYETTKKGKTKNANRTIPLLPPVEKALKGRKGLLISGEKGTPCTPTIWKKTMLSYKHQMEEAINGIGKRWYGRTKEQKKLMEEGNLPPWVEFTVVPYDLRHSFCTMCRDNGVELHTCIEWMGHADAKMIMKIYDEVSDNRSQIEAEKLKKRLFHVQNDVQQKEKQPESVDL